MWVCRNQELLSLELPSPLGRWSAVHLASKARPGGGQLPCALCWLVGLLPAWLCRSNLLIHAHDTSLMTMNALWFFFLQAHFLGNQAHDMLIQIGRLEPKLQK